MPFYLNSDSFCGAIVSGSLSEFHFSPCDWLLFVTKTGKRLLTFLKNTCYFFWLMQNTSKLSLKKKKNNCKWKEYLRKSLKKCISFSFVLLSKMMSPQGDVRILSKLNVQPVNKTDTWLHEVQQCLLCVFCIWRLFCYDVKN